jgi:peptidoglycan/xylan/chitin deacetylase (PgdA/CDA1 family)
MREWRSEPGAAAVVGSLDKRAVLGMHGNLRRRILFLFLRMTLVPLLVRRVVQRNQATILVYHAPSPDAFGHHISRLVRLYSVISLRDFVAARQKHSLGLLPKRPLVITLDDGHQSNYRLVPVLSRWNVPVTIFVTRSQTKPYDAPRLSCEQIDHLRDIADIQSHTLNHVNLSQSTLEIARQEIVGAREHLQGHHGIRVYAFAYPDGAYSERDMSLLRACGYVCAVTTEPGFNSAATDLLCLKRIVIPDDAGIDELIVKSSGLWAALRRVVKGPIRGSSPVPANRLHESADETPQGG